MSGFWGPLPTELRRFQANWSALVFCDTRVLGSNDGLEYMASTAPVSAFTTTAAAPSVVVCWLMATATWLCSVEFTVRVTLSTSVRLTSRSRSVLAGRSCGVR